MFRLSPQQRHPRGRESLSIPMNLIYRDQTVHGTPYSYQNTSQDISTLLVWYPEAYGIFSVYDEIRRPCHSGQAPFLQPYRDFPAIFSGRYPPDIRGIFLICSKEPARNNRLRSLRDRHTCGRPATNVISASQPCAPLDDAPLSCEQRSCELLSS